MYAFSWDSQPELNDPSLNSPQACRWGARCVYNKSCAFVHPGEEGTGRMLFPGRISMLNGSQIWERPVVRLIGRAHFYERRRLKLSWPQWCSLKNMPPPVSIKEMWRKRYHTRIDELLTYNKETMISENSWHPTITTENVTTKVFNTIDTNKLEELWNNDGEFGTVVAKACNEIYEASLV